MKRNLDELMFGASPATECAMQELAQFAPIVTDAAFDLIEQEADDRFQLGKDPLIAKMLLAIRSLRQEIQSFDARWQIGLDAITYRMRIEIECYRRALGLAEKIDLACAPQPTGGPA